MSQYGGVDNPSFDGDQRQGSLTTVDGGSGGSNSGGGGGGGGGGMPPKQSDNTKTAGMDDKESKKSFLYPPIDDGLKKRKSADDVGYDVTEVDHTAGIEDCGIGRCHPDILQRFKTIGWFTALYGVSGITTSALSTYIGSQITTLEKHFNFNSSVSGLLLSCNDFGYFLTCLFLSYLTRRIHIPRILSMAIVLFGLSGLVCTIPYFGTRDVLMGVSQGNSSNASKPVSPGQMCIRDIAVANSTSCHGAPEDTGGAGGIHGVSAHWRTLAIVLIGGGMVVQGVAKSPRQSFVGVYIDDNVPKTRTSFYLGIITGMGIFGPSISFVLGGVFSGIYITLEDTDLTNHDPRWLGAWWLGFLVFGSMSLVVGLPLLFFPRKMMIKPEVEMAEMKRKQKGEGQNKALYEFKEFFIALWKLAKNPLYVLLIIGEGFTTMSIGGMMSFMPKYMEEHFGMPASTANIVLGALTVGGATIGTTIGGLLVSKKRLSPRSCLKLHIGLMFLTLTIQLSSLLIKCDQPIINKGDTIRFGNVSHCSSPCDCNEFAYFPICGDDGLNYFSPCHAGCTDILDGGNKFSNCSCLFSNEFSQASGGLCGGDCVMKFWIFASVSFASSFAMCLSIMPSFITTVRSVPEDEKPMALGIQAFMSTLLGWLPAPVIFGNIVDTTCLLTQSSPCKNEANVDGACQLYDLQLFRNKYNGMVLGLRFISFIVTSCAFLLVKYSSKKRFSDHEDEKLHDDDDEKDISMAETKPAKSNKTSRSGDVDKQ